MHTSQHLKDISDECEWFLIGSTTTDPKGNSEIQVPKTTELPFQGQEASSLKNKGFFSGATIGNSCA